MLVGIPSALHAFLTKLASNSSISGGASSLSNGLMLLFFGAINAMLSGGRLLCSLDTSSSVFIVSCLWNRASFSNPCSPGIRLFSFQFNPTHKRPAQSDCSAKSARCSSRSPRCCSASPCPAPPAPSWASRSSTWPAARTPVS